VLAMGPGNPPAVGFLAGGSVRFGYRPGEKPDLLCLGGVVTRTGHKPTGCWLGGTAPLVNFRGLSALAQLWPQLSIRVLIVS